MKNMPKRPFENMKNMPKRPCLPVRAVICSLHISTELKVDIIPQYCTAS